MQHVHLLPPSLSSTRQDPASGDAYLVRSCPVMTIAVSRLHPDWLDTDGLCSKVWRRVCVCVWKLGSAVLGGCAPLLPALTSMHATPSLHVAALTWRPRCLFPAVAPVRGG